MQLQGIVLIQLQGNDILVNCEEIDSFKEHIFFEAIIFFHEIIFISRNLSVHSRRYALVQGKHIHSGKLYPFKEIYISLMNIYSFKFKAILIEHCCVREHSRNNYSGTSI